MKKTLLLLVLSIISGTLKAQGYCALRDSLLYATAYNYICADSIGTNSNIFPSNRLVNTSYAWFIDVIESSNNDTIKKVIQASLIPSSFSQSRQQKDETALMSKLQKIDEQPVSSDTNNLKFSFPKTYKDSKFRSYEMFFSPIRWDEFFVSLELPSTLMGGGYIYFFIFNPDMTIKSVYLKEIYGL